MNNNQKITPTQAIKNITDFHKSTLNFKNGRYQSWNHCYLEFQKQHTKGVASAEEIDGLALNLAFYLASFGMYRASSFLLNNDYKIHHAIVELILEEQYASLFAMSAEQLLDTDTRNLIFELSYRIKDHYASTTISKSLKKNNATDTLVTKILLGTNGCVPAYDRFYKRAVRHYAITSGSFNSNSLKKLAQFYLDNKEVFEVKRMEIAQDGFLYPQMKLMDMCFFTAGLQMEK